MLFFLLHTLRPKIFFLQHRPSGLADPNNAAQLSPFMQRALMPHGDLIIDAVSRVNHIPDIEPAEIKKAFDTLHTYFSSFHLENDLPGMSHYSVKMSSGTNEAVQKVKHIVALLSQYSKNLPHNAQHILKELFHDLQVSGILFPASVVQDFQRALPSVSRAPYEMVEAYRGMDRAITEFRQYSGDPYLGDTPTILSRGSKTSLEDNINTIQGHDASSRTTLENFYTEKFYEAGVNPPQRNKKSLEDVLQELKNTSGYRKNVFYQKKFERHFRAYFALKLLQDAKRELENKKKDILGTEIGTFQRFYRENLTLVQRYITSLNPKDTHDRKILSTIFLSQPRYFAMTGNENHNALLRERLTYVLSSNYTVLFEKHRDSLNTRIKREGKYSRTLKRLHKLHSTITPPIKTSVTPPINTVDASLYYADILMHSFANMAHLYDDPKALSEEEGHEKWLRRTAEVGSKMKIFFSDTLKDPDHWIQKGVTKLDNAIIHTADLIIGKGIGNILGKKVLENGSAWVDTKIKDNRKKLKEFQKNVMAAKSEAGAWGRMKWLARQPFRPFTKLLSGTLAVTSGVTGTTAALAKGTSDIVNTIITSTGNAYNGIYGNPVATSPQNTPLVASDPKGIARTLFQLSTFTLKHLSGAGAGIFNQSYDALDRRKIKSEMESIGADLAGEARPLLEQLGLLEVLSPRTELSAGLDVNPMNTPSAPLGAPPPSSPQNTFDTRIFLEERFIELVNLSSRFQDRAKKLEKIRTRVTMTPPPTGNDLDSIKTGMKRWNTKTIDMLEDLERILALLEIGDIHTTLTNTNKTILSEMQIRVEALKDNIVKTPDIAPMDSTHLAQLSLWDVLDASEGLPQLRREIDTLRKNPLP